MDIVFKNPIARPTIVGAKIEKMDINLQVIGNVQTLINVMVFYSIDKESGTLNVMAPDLVGQTIDTLPALMADKLEEAVKSKFQ